MSTHVLWLKLYRFVYLSLSLYGTNMQSMNPREYSFPRLFFAYCFISWYVCRLSLVTIGSCKHYLLGVGVSASSCMHSPKLLRSVAEPHLCSLSLFFFFPHECMHSILLICVRLKCCVNRSLRLWTPCHHVQTMLSTRFNGEII